MVYIEENIDGCKTCKNKYHTTDEHEIFEEYFKKSKEDLVSIIISLEVELYGRG